MALPRVPFDPQRFDMLMNEAWLDSVYGRSRGRDETALQRAYRIVFETNARLRSDGVELAASPPDDVSGERAARRVADALARAIGGRRNGP